MNPSRITIFEPGYKYDSTGKPDFTGATLNNNPLKRKLSSPAPISYEIKTNNLPLTASLFNPKSNSFDDYAAVAKARLMIPSGND